MTSLSIPTRREVSEVVLRLPLATSKNRLLRRLGNGRVHRTPAYRKWQADAGWMLQFQKPGRVSGAYALTIGIPEDARGDLGNYETATSDLLQAHGVVDNDRDAARITSERQSFSPEMIVRVTAWGQE